MTSVRRNRRAAEGGFALLLVFAFAAAIAIGIYMEMPRAVFESARAKEELLVERGQQYQLAIRRFYMKNKAYPQTIEQLEETNGVRFLRRRYKDPMTGSDEWRLIHIGPGGFTDSKVFKPQNPAEKKQVYESSITAGYSVGQAPVASGPAGMQGVAMRQRPGDQLRPGQEQAEADPEQAERERMEDRGVLDTESEPADAAPPPPGPENPETQPPPNPGVLPALPGQLQPGQPGQNPPPPPGSFAPAPQPSGSFATAPPPSSSFGPAPMPPGLGPAPGISPGAATVPGLPGQPANPALQLIQNQLRSPQPSAGAGGFPGPVPTGPTGAQPGAVFAGGIAGVASKYEGEGIKRIHDRSRIDEWEFVFDATKMTGQNPQAAAPGQGPLPGQTPAFGAAPGGAPPSLNRPPAGSPPGATSFGGSTSFGPIQPPSGQQPPQRPQPGAGGVGPPGMGNRPRP